MFQMAQMAIAHVSNRRAQQMRNRPFIITVDESEENVTEISGQIYLLSKTERFGLYL